MSNLSHSFLGNTLSARQNWIYLPVKMQNNHGHQFLVHSGIFYLKLKIIIRFFLRSHFVIFILKIFLVFPAKSLIYCSIYSGTSHGCSWICIYAYILIKDSHALFNLTKYCDCVGVFLVFFTSLYHLSCCCTMQERLYCKLS